jgi:pimeloyl-ACP methyl ester carboxylesterase
METVTSQDGTAIAFDRLGSGPAVVLVTGGSVDRGSNAALADRLAANYSVLNYDRRGRGPSGDTQPYSMQREIEDIAAVIEAAGGTAHLYGSSSGAALALEAAAAGVAIAKLALWEPPYIVGDDRPRPPANTAEIYSKFVAEGRRGDAVEYFMSTVVGMPEGFAAFARTQPWWPAQEALAHTLAYDATVMGDYTLPLETAARVRVPTLIASGTASFPWIANTAKALAAVIPGARTASLEGQSHDVSATALAPVLEEFFGR